MERKQAANISRVYSDWLGRISSTGTLDDLSTCSATLPINALHKTAPTVSRYCDQSNLILSSIVYYGRPGATSTTAYPPESPFLP
jgi:hypothetical protein